MFDLSPDEIQETVQDTIHGFAEAEIRPVAREAEAAKEVPERIVKQIGEMGFAAAVPEDLGGSGVFDSVTMSLIAEELAWGDPAIASAILSAGQPAHVLALAGTDEQQAEHLPAFFAGAPIRGSLMLYERLAGSDLGSLRTTVRRVGGDWQVNGEKCSVPFAGSGDLRILVAGIEGSDEVAAFILPKSVSPKLIRDDSQAGKIGMRAAPTGSVAFENVFIPGDAIVGGADRNPNHLVRSLDLIRLETGAIALGLARAAAEYAGTYATDRIAFGKPIGAFQGVAFMVTDMAMDVEATRLLIWDAASRIDSGISASRAVSLANSKAIKTALRCGTDSVQVLGGHGFIVDHPVEKWYRDAAALAGSEGPLDADPILSETYVG